ncbi:hypothetical protein [Agromyces neolithicus]|uniref:Peptidase M23 n=1 Tax=Agromyces neolithicus TaxID=269420 RepID=A0ABP4YKD4_9MICO
MNEKGGGALMALLAVVLAPVIIIVVLFAGVGASAAATCSPQVIAPKAGSVAGYSGDQLENAAAIMNAATALKLPREAQIIGVMTAMGESSLKNISHGDGAINPDGSVATSIGLFQQQEWKGSAAQRMDPFTSATIFFQDLMGVPNWQALEPTEVAHLVQVNADPNHYTKWYAPAVQVVTALETTRKAGACSVSGNAQALATEIVNAKKDGRFKTLEDEYWTQIQNIAEGKSAPNCGIDVGVLQMIVVALHNFESVGVSDLNRKCTGSLLGAGTGSSHWVNGGGNAVDFYMLNGQSLTGADEHSLKLIRLLDPMVPVGARAGQVDVRAAAGASLSLKNFTQFDDSPDHLHLDLAYAETKVLNITTD